MQVWREDDLAGEIGGGAGNVVHDPHLAPEVTDHCLDLRPTASFHFRFLSNRSRT